MVELNFPTYPFRLKSKENKVFIFDILRKKEVVLTPEEWVRQHVLHWLINAKKYPASIIAIEKQLQLNKITKRTDILIFDKSGQPDVIIECKAPHISITQNSFDQIARYNLKLNANVLMVTNGLQHYYCAIDHTNEAYVFLPELPTYQK
ncbi:type I restriction enzyme HsdR N-terminal domain-containing protein [Namhaeicola litoreus]|uniref:Type I restriction enzyme HsdR N-terminal domain-containing protein n=1 Tax=Namhaeicola litoreus TaxID=1052145 RepID=A0ABW3Y5J0_9FLAO